MSFELDRETREFIRAAASSEPHLSPSERERLKLAVLAKGVASAGLPAAAALAASSRAAASTGAATLKTASAAPLSVKALAVWLASGAGLGVATVGTAELMQRVRTGPPNELVATTGGNSKSSSQLARALGREATSRVERPLATGTPSAEKRMAPPVGHTESRVGPNESRSGSREDATVEGSTARPAAAARAFAGGEASGISTASQAEPRRTLALSAELELMNELQVALRDGSSARAEELIARHTREFPEGQFRLERLAAKVFAACERGDRALAEQTARAFLAEDADSALAARVRTSCAGIRP